MATSLNGFLINYGFHNGTAQWLFFDAIFWHFLLRISSSACNRFILPHTVNANCSCSCHMCGISLSIPDLITALITALHVLGFLNGNTYLHPNITSRVAAFTFPVIWTAATGSIYLLPLAKLICTESRV